MMDFGDDPLAHFLEDWEPGEPDFIDGAAERSGGASHSTNTLPPGSSNSIIVEAAGISGFTRSINSRVACSRGPSVGLTVAPSSEKNASPPGPPSSTVRLTNFSERARTMNQLWVICGFEKKATTMVRSSDRQSQSRSVTSLIESAACLLTATNPTSFSWLRNSFLRRAA